jgi:MFS family permease
MYRELKRMFELTKLKDDLHEIYFNQVIETFAISLISIFIPIYLLENGFSVLDSFTFMLVYWGAMFLFTPIAAEISSKIGFKHTIIYRAPLLIVFFSTLLLIQYLSSIILFIALLGGFSSILYWVSTNAEFVKNTSDGNQSKQIGYLNALPQISATIAPLISAFILTVLGFPILFAIVISLVIVSQIPFLLTGDYKEKFSARKGEWLFLDRRFFLLFLIQGVIFSNEFLTWNVFIFQKFGLISMGLSATLFGAGMAVFTFLVGNVSSNSRRRRNILILGALGYTLTCILRISTTTPLEAILISLLAGICTTMVSLPIYAEFCGRAKKDGVINWVTFRDVWLASGRVTFVLLACAALLLDSQNYFAISFFLAGMFSLLLVVLAK